MRLVVALAARRLAAATCHRAGGPALTQQLWRRYSTQALFHPTAVIGGGATIGEGVSIGPFCIVSDSATIGPHCELGPSVHIMGDTTLGARCVIRSHAVIGAEVRERERCVRILIPSCVKMFFFSI